MPRYFTANRLTPSAKGRTYIRALTTSAMMVISMAGRAHSRAPRVRVCGGRLLPKIGGLSARDARPSAAAALRHHGRFHFAGVGWCRELPVETVSRRLRAAMRNLGRAGDRVTRPQSVGLHRADGAAAAAGFRRRKASGFSANRGSGPAPSRTQERAPHRQRGAAPARIGVIHYPRWQLALTLRQGALPCVSALFARSQVNVDLGHSREEGGRHDPLRWSTSDHLCPLGRTAMPALRRPWISPLRRRRAPACARQLRQRYVLALMLPMPRHGSRAGGCSVARGVAARVAEIDERSGSGRSARFLCGRCG